MWACLILISAKFYTSDCYCHLKTTLLLVDCLSSDAQIRTCFAKMKLLMLKVKKKLSFVLVNFMSTWWKQSYLEGGILIEKIPPSLYLQGIFSINNCHGKTSSLGGLCPWASGPVLHKKSSWARHGEQGSKQCFSMTSASVPTLGSWPVFISWSKL